ncbi:ABC transporter permease [Paenibacillus apiarius]|uniref:ABC-2 family transporter protein n=3 Tax=Paenibacillus apiarius TaxID=46240 RepID=A0ABT4DQZ2_9BACL|nr:ABC-2 family transporter protein [Paenibacillus apiarius]MCY9517582.1 ABC-2 family transporter protein [Paenibacillus apiarius]MCY9519771.1 ABC-2 family transporter protein [Paenibacillus apiarius]MCY9559344.1 ABC-2 family transporter protein [Paenibacillus apiarius]MCY9682703.1 ABC-2 family transporter protein [Paenibacillus apiarius]MCY9722592.1 ABC-2 family transporter protein [Paenibacillus apiarius]
MGKCGSLKTIIRYLSIYYIIVRNCFLNELEYRTNFIMQIFASLASLLSHFVYVIVVYKSGANIAGLTPDHVLLFMGTYFILTAVYAFFFVNNFVAFQHHVRQGTLDMYITKPVSLQFILSVRLINVMGISDFIVGVIVVCFAWNRLGIQVDAVNLFGYAGYIICGVILTYALFMLPQVLAFWITNTGNLYNIGAQLWDANIMPMVIYNRAIRTIGTFVIPVFVISNFAPLYLLDKLNFYELLWGICVPFLFLGLVRYLFVQGLKSYTSASQ